MGHELRCVKCHVPAHVSPVPPVALSTLRLREQLLRIGPPVIPALGGTS